MSRYAENEPDFDRYEPKPIDVQDEPTDDPEPDPAEHAAHSAMSALDTLRQQIADSPEFPRVMDLWKIVRAIEVAAAEVVNVAAARCDEITERRR